MAMNRAGLPPALAAGLAGVRRAWDSTWSFLSMAVATFSSAIMVSAILHVLVIFGVTHTQINPRLFENTHPPLDVVLVNAKSKSAPLKAEVLAQHNLDGGGNVEEERRATSPLAASETEQPKSAEAEFNARVQALEAQTKALMTQLKSDYKAPAQNPQPPAEPRPPSPVPAPVDLTARSLEMARLRASIDTQMDEYQKRPRKLFLGARAKEYTFAQYVTDWSQKVERVGNMNYPEAARRNHIYGSLILEVCIKSDGSLYDEEDSPTVLKSSGAKILDAAAIKIVRLSSPYSAFPADMRAGMTKLNMDVFCITRTWSFTRSDQLTSQ
jgi:protein TonB